MMSTCTDCGMNINFSYSIINPKTQTIAVTSTSLIIISETSETLQSTTESQSNSQMNYGISIGIVAAIIVLAVTALAIRSRKQGSKSK